MFEELAKKVAIITGASRGIGAATARELAGHGASVVLAARSTDQIESVAAGIRETGGEASAIGCDVSRYADVDALVQRCIEQYGALDILVNNAGVIEPITQLADSDPEAWTRAADINYQGVYFGLRAALPVMLSRGGGVIVNVSSGAATSPLEGWSHYCSAKAAALMLTRCADLEYRDRGIRVVGLSPGTVATDMQVVIKRSGVNPVSQMDPSAHKPPEWVARAVAWLCTADGAEFAGTDFRLSDPDSLDRLGLG